MIVIRPTLGTWTCASSSGANRRRLRSVAVIVAAALVVSAQSAVAGEPAARLDPPAPWTPVVRLSPAGVADTRPDVELDALGTTTAAWVGTIETPLKGLVVRRKPADAGWQPAEVLDDRGQGSVDIESDTTGAVTIAYGRQPGARPRGSVPFAVSATPSGAFGEPVRLSAEGVFFDRLHLVVARDGTATAVWIAVLEGDARRIAVARRPPGGTWQPPRYITGTGTRALELAVDVGHTGDVTVLWTSRVLNVGSNARTVHSRTLTGEDWSRKAILSAPEEDRGFSLEVTAGARGTAWASWVHLGPLAELDQGVFAKRRLDGTWTTPRKLPGNPGGGPAETEVAHGRTVMMWISGDGTGDFPFFKDLLGRVRENGKWGKPVKLSEPNGTVVPADIEADARGRFRAIWEYQRPITFNGWEYQVQTRRLDTGGRWSDLVALSSRRAHFFTTAMSLGLGGAVEVVWTQVNPTTERRGIRATGIDAP